ncbi:hypothetical protein BH09PAT4_BH09PAT4_09280 [soil metagenome]
MYLFLSAFVLNAMREKRVENAAAKVAEASSQQATEYHPPTIAKAKHRKAVAAVISHRSGEVASSPVATAAPKTILETSPPMASVLPPITANVPMAEQASVAAIPVSADKPEVLPAIIQPNPVSLITLPACGCGPNLKTVSSILCPMSEQSVSAMVCAVL